VKRRDNYARLNKGENLGVIIREEGMRNKRQVLRDEMVSKLKGNVSRPDYCR